MARNIPVRAIGNLASVFISVDGDSEDSDYRAVPSTDRGNAGYSDRGMRGTFATNRGEPWSDPAGLVRFEGYGASADDLRRGYIGNCADADPAYDLINYKDRATQPRVADEDFENTAMLDNDFAFRARNRRARGFLSRPRLPTER